MDATREIYWNVGLGVVLPMYVFTALFTITCAYWFIRRIAVYRKGKPLSRLDRLPERLLGLLKKGAGQAKVMRVRKPGLTHAFLFWGTILLFIGTLLIMIQVDFTKPLFDVTFLKGNFYRGYSFVLDVAGIAALAMLIAFAVRRFIYRPKGLKIIVDDYLIHLLFAAILVTGFYIEGARMAVTEIRQNPELARFSPVGKLVALTMIDWDPAALRTLHKDLWWIHFFFVMGLIAALPWTKLRHIFTTPAGNFFEDLRPKGAIATPNLEAEGATQFGAGAVTDFVWKDLFDADACMACKRCQDRCPAWATAKPLSPMLVVQQLGEAAFSKSPIDLIDLVTTDVLWACTTCRACQDICPADIEHVNKILEMRRHLVLMRGEFPGPEVVAAVRDLEMNFNPFGMTFASRGDWATGLDVARVDEGGRADIVYFAGCFASFDKRNQQVARSFVRVCQAAGIRVGILGREEKCCGEPLRKLGNEYLYQIVAVENIAKLNASGASRIVTTCPHCYNTLGVDYRDLGFEMEVEHSTVFIERLMRDGRLPIKAAEFECTYHDSCYLSRYRGIVDEPRTVLRAAGGRIAEMRASKEDTFCCGAGGARILAEERIGTRINAARVGMARDAGAPMLVSSCPFCLTMFEDGIKACGEEETMKARDLVELVDERLAAENT
jgi:Fe-S oxidoreductase/nitrate reductase gamma subunit